MKVSLTLSVRQNADVSMIVAPTAAGKRAFSVYRTGVIILFRNRQSRCGRDIFSIREFCFYHVYKYRNKSRFLTFL